MATLETPPPQPTPPPPSPRRRATDEIEPFMVPILLEQMQDDLARSRKREALWASVVFHLLIIIVIFTSPKWTKWIPARTVVIATPQELIQQQQELTYLNLPSDEQKLTQKPKTDTISDKDRVASSRHPELNRHELKKILDSALPGAPGPAMPMPHPAPQQQAAVPPQQGAGPHGQQQGQQQAATSQGPIYPDARAQQQAKAQPGPNPFAAGGTMSPGSAIEQAARAAAANRAGAGGDYGTLTPSPSPKQSALEILSDTLGVDFGPYLSRLQTTVRRNWVDSLPESASPPLLKKGTVILQVAIMKDGSIAGLKLVSSSGDISLDRAAFAGITLSAPFSPLPDEFRGNYLLLRATFECNTGKYSFR